MHAYYCRDRGSRLPPLSFQWTTEQVPITDSKYVLNKVLPDMVMAVDDVFCPLYKHYSSACDLEADSHLCHEWGIRLPRAENKWHVQARFFDRSQQFSTGKFVVVVQHVMGLRNPQACLLLWIAVPEDCRSRGSRLPITSLFWIVGQAHLPTLLCCEKRNDNRFCPDAVLATKQESLTFACNLIWSDSDEMEVLSGSELPDTV